MPLCCVQVQQLQGVYNLQEPHFWTLCSDVYIGTLKLLVAPDADTRWILSQTHNIFTQVGGGLEPRTRHRNCDGDERGSNLTCCVQAGVRQLYVQMETAAM